MFSLELPGVPVLETLVVDSELCVEPLDELDRDDDDVEGIVVGVALVDLVTEVVGVVETVADDEFDGGVAVVDDEFEPEVAGAAG